MKIRKFIFLFLIGLSTCGCNNNREYIKTICPIGAPTLAFYSEVSNDNFVTESASNKVLAEFQKNEYDIIVLDSTSGLLARRKYNNCNYKFYKLLTANNLYLVSFKNTVPPKNEDTILSFGNENSIPYLTLKSICTNKLGKTDFLETNERVDSISNVIAFMKNNIFYKDYFLIAEPSLTDFKNNFKDKEIKYCEKLNEISSFIDYIPQAAIFINKNSYINKKKILLEYVNNVKSNIETAINEINVVTNTLNKYGNDQELKIRLGFTSSLVKQIQNNHQNGFGLYSFNYKEYTEIEINDFLDKIDYDKSFRFTSDDFIKL